MSIVQKDYDARSGGSGSPMSLYHSSKSQETGKSGTRTPDSEAVDSFSQEAFLCAELDAHFSNAREEMRSMMLEERAEMQAVLAKERAEMQAVLAREIDKFSSRMLDRMVTLVVIEVARAEVRAAERHQEESGA